MTHGHGRLLPDPQGRMPWYRTWAGLAGLGTVAAAALYLSLHHADHVLDALPLAVLLLCPLMHLFMHGGHGHGGQGHSGQGHGGRRPGGHGDDPGSPGGPAR